MAKIQRAKLNLRKPEPTVNLKNCSHVRAYVYNCRTQHSIEQFWQSSLLSSRQLLSSLRRCCLQEGRGQLHYLVETVQCQAMIILGIANILVYWQLLIGKRTYIVYEVSSRLTVERPCTHCNAVLCNRQVIKKTERQTVAVERVT